MIENPEFNLIKGTFSPEQAKNILNSLINSKINFHNLEDFSNSIRFSLDDSYSKKRIEELNEMKIIINQLMSNADLKGHKVEMKCQFEIKLV